MKMKKKGKRLLYHIYGKGDPAVYSGITAEVVRCSSQYLRTTKKMIHTRTHTDRQTETKNDEAAANISPCTKKILLSKNMRKNHNNNTVRIKTSPKTSTLGTNRERTTTGDTEGI